MPAAKRLAQRICETPRHCMRSRNGVVLLLIAYIFATSGMPVSIVSTSGSSVERYPCEGGCCGCQSAQQCWQSCCCHTLSERLAWARRHNIRPPSYVIAFAKVADSESQVAHHTADRVLIGPQKPADLDSVCGRTGSSSTQERTNCCLPSQRTNRDVPSSRQVITVQAFRCQGLSQALSFVSILAIPFRSICHPASLSPTDWITPPHSDRLPTAYHEPLEPPPELGATV